MSVATRIRVSSVEHLKALCDNGAMDFVVGLTGGIFSRKNISWDGEEFYVFNGIDGSCGSFTVESIQESFIGRAIEAGAVYTDL